MTLTHQKMSYRACACVFKSANCRWRDLSTLLCRIDQGSPGYNINMYCPRSSYFRDYITTARGLGVLPGESSLSVGAYVRDVDLSSLDNQLVRDGQGLKASTFRSHHLNSISISCGHGDGTPFLPSTVDGGWGDVTIPSPSSGGWYQTTPPGDRFD